MTESIKKKLEEIKKKLDSTDWETVNSQAIEEYVRQLEQLFAYEETRIDNVESKSTTIIGASGLIATFVFGIVGLYQKSPVTINRAVLVVAGFLVLASLILLLFTILFSLRVRGIKKYWYPSNIDSILDGMTLTIEDIRKERLIDLVGSLTNNFEITNEKVDDLRVSQKLFFGAVTLVILDALMIVAYSLINICK